MTTKDGEVDEALLTPAQREAMARLVEDSGRRRITSADFDGKTVWIKRYDVERPGVFMRLHGLLSPLSPWPFLRASPLVGPAGQMERELRKLHAFRAAGIVVPSVLYRGEAVLVLGHVAEIAQDRLQRLRRKDPAAHDRALIGAAAALGKAHSAGLCHGRPHARDMFVSRSRWGFVDFEEEPEAVMPLAAAQARDVWLLFMQISSRALAQDTEVQALVAYRRAAPAEVLGELRAMIRVLSPLIVPLALVEKVRLGGDGRRMLAATRFLARALTGRDATEWGLKEG